MTRRVRCAFALASLLAAGAAAAQPVECRLQPIEGTGSVEVAAVRDGRTLALKDGTELRLAAIETPAGVQAEPAHAALQKLVPPGTTLKLMGLGRAERDRYGRRVAFAFLPDSQQSLQQTMIDLGEAWVSADVGDWQCARFLLTTENAAHLARRGFWADPNFAPLPADRAAQLAAAQGRFVLVEGTVTSVHESNGTIYLNFGPPGSGSFSVVIPSRLQRAFTVVGVEPGRMTGRRIRARGWVEYRSGPIIEATAPEQIELLF